MNQAERNTQLALEPIVDALDELLHSYQGQISPRLFQDISYAGKKLSYVVETLADMPGNPDGRN